MKPLQLKVEEERKMPDGQFIDEVTYISTGPNNFCPVKPQRKSILVFKTLAFVTLLYLWWSYVTTNYGFGRLPRKHSNEKLLDFDEITPSEKLEWHPCFAYEPAFKCARLTVPMDYHRPLNESEDNPKVHVALVLVPGKHTGAEKSSTSPLLLNPGGPGGSGAMFALGLGNRIQDIVGEDQDVIGFDPRGIGATTPRTDCFSYPVGWPNTQLEDPTTGGGEDYVTGNFHRLLWQTTGREVGNVNSTSGSLEILDTRAKAHAKLCQEKDSILGRDSIFKYVNTPNVVRDMISIIDAWDEWTESQSCRMHKSQDAAEDEVSSNESRLDTKGKLVYWGFSYGTLLGATFASMFPQRVGRVILDGVVDADHYVAPVWMNSIRDADTIFESFPGYCYKGKELCALYRAGDEVKDVERRFFGTLDDLKENPILLTDPNSHTPIIISYSEVRRILFSILYAPTYGFGVVAMIMDFILKGQFQAIAPIFSISFPFEIYPVCGEPRPAWMYPDEAQPAIMCSDKRYPLNETLPNLKDMFENMSNISSFADVWLPVMLGCEGWGIEAIDPPMRWDDHPAHKQKPINTSFPVLFISNTYDPVTPLRAGVDMAKKFVDAGLIEQQSMGHCSIAAVSLCTISKIKAYFTKGEVSPPPKHGGNLEDGEWDRCKADEWPFHPFNGNQLTATSGVTTEDVKAMDAFKQIQDVFAEMKHWGQPQVLRYSSLKGF